MDISDKTEVYMEGKMKNKWITSLNGMGIGLLSTLVVGTIMVQLGSLFELDLLIKVGNIAKVLMAAAIGAGVSHALNAKPIIIFSAIVTACIGGGAIQTLDGEMVLKIGEPAGAYIAALLTTWMGLKIHGKTKMDIILVPMLCIVFGGIIGEFVSPLVTEITQSIGGLINYATELKPLYMGALISAIMCLVILSPVSSAALAVGLGLNGLAAGAAVIGCACSMIGFAVCSYPVNGVSGLISLGLGTSKIQFGNAINNPHIITPTLMASIIVGMIGTMVFKMECNSLGAGMGTSGLVGPIQTIAVMGSEGCLGVILCHFILPALISWIVSRLMVSKGYIQHADMILVLD